MYIRPMMAVNWTSWFFRDWMHSVYSNLDFDIWVSHIVLLLLGLSNKHVSEGINTLLI